MLDYLTALSFNRRNERKAMSSTNLDARALVLVGLVGALSLPNTARAQSVTPERALLNRLPGIPCGTARAFTRVQAPTTGQPVLTLLGTQAAMRTIRLTAVDH
jgi:hypothetical protein